MYRFKKSVLIMAMACSFIVPLTAYAKVDVENALKEQIETNKNPVSTGIHAEQLETESVLASILASEQAENSTSMEQSISNQEITQNQAFLSSAENVQTEQHQDNSENAEIEITYKDEVETSDSIETSDSAEYSSDESLETTESAEYSSGESLETSDKNNASLTPEGNFSLVDDVESLADDKSREFLTIVTKGGNYLYLVIDKNGETENVHMLNMVDEADLLSLINEEPVKVPATEIPTPTPVIEEVVEAPKEEPEPIEKASTESIFNRILLILLLIGGGIAGYLYYKKTHDYIEVYQNEDVEQDTINKNQGNVQEEVDVEALDELFDDLNKSEFNDDKDE